MGTTSVTPAQSSWLSVLRLLYTGAHSTVLYTRPSQMTRWAVIDNVGWLTGLRLSDILRSYAALTPAYLMLVG